MWKGNLSLPCIQPRLYDSMPYNTQKPNLALALWKGVYIYKYITYIYIIICGSITFEKHVQT